MKLLFPVIMVSILSGCISLKVRDSKVKKESAAVVMLRQQNAELKAKNLDYEEQFRVSTGKIEELEIRLRRSGDSSQKRLGEESQQLQAYKDSVAELVEEKKKLENEVLMWKEKHKSAKRAAVSAKRTAKEHLTQGNKFFDSKKWSEAASEYQSYREKARSKKTQDYALSTYKIGVCFQELGLKKEAKTFYKSVISKYKGQKAAKYAKYRLDNLK